MLLPIPVAFLVLGAALALPGPPQAVLSPVSRQQNPHRYAELAAQYPTLCAEEPPVKVPVVLGVMSRCPDAIYCEGVIDEVLGEVGELVEVELTFIGRLNTSDTEYGVTCMHGPLECAGNVHELCAASRELDLPTSPPQWWTFTQCLNSLGRDMIGLDASARACALQAGIDWTAPDGVGSCVSSGEGVDLLKESVRVTSELGITNSCTVLVDGEKVCVRDDGKWKQCEGDGSVGFFVQKIEEAYAKLNGEDDDDAWVLL